VRYASSPGCPADSGAAGWQRARVLLGRNEECARPDRLLADAKPRRARVIDCARSAVRIRRTGWRADLSSALTDAAQEVAAESYAFSSPRWVLGRAQVRDSGSPPRSRERPAWDGSTPVRSLPRMATIGEDRLNGRLSPDRERALVSAAANGDQAARDRTVEVFMPLIGSVARRYCRVPGVERAELMHEGVAGLLEAIRRYDVELGTPFWAYAAWWVRQSMQRFVAEMGRPVVLSDRAIRKLACIRDARSQLNRAGNQEPTTEDLMTVTGSPATRSRACSARCST
jgi:hypothetical protein